MKPLDGRDKARESEWSRWKEKRKVSKCKSIPVNKQLHRIIQPSTKIRDSFIRKNEGKQKEEKKRRKRRKWNQAIQTFLQNKRFLFLLSVQVCLPVCLPIQFCFQLYKLLSNRLTDRRDVSGECLTIHRIPQRQLTNERFSRAEVK